MSTTRPDTEHHLLIEDVHLDALISGEKTYELRQRRDRDFQVGDELVFTREGFEYRFLISHIGTLERVAEWGGGAFGKSLSDWNILSVHRMVY